MVLIGSRFNNVRRLCPLPETATELTCIAERTGGSTVLGQDFTKAQLMQLNNAGKLAEYRVIEFATHGLCPKPTRIGPSNRP